MNIVSHSKRIWYVVSKTNPETSLTWGYDGEIFLPSGSGHTWISCQGSNTVFLINPNNLFSSPLFDRKVVRWPLDLLVGISVDGLARDGGPKVAVITRRRDNARDCQQTVASRRKTRVTGDARGPAALAEDVPGFSTSARNYNARTHARLCRLSSGHCARCGRTSVCARGSFCGVRRPAVAKFDPPPHTIWSTASRHERSEPLGIRFWGVVPAVATRVRPLMSRLHLTHFLESFFVRFVSQLCRIMSSPNLDLFHSLTVLSSGTLFWLNRVYFMITLRSVTSP